MVGTAIRMLEERLGLLGRILGFAGGLAWVVATYLVIPVLAFEDVGPIEAIKRSSSMFKNRFGTVARSGLRFGVLFGAASVLAAIVLVAGIALAAAGSATLAVGIVVAVLGFCALIGIAMYATRGRHLHAHDPVPLRDRPARPRARRRHGERLPPLLSESQREIPL